MAAKIPKKIEEYVLVTVAGADVLTLTHYLQGKSNISEFIIAKDLEKEINIIRNLLYKLLHVDLVTFTRKKDKQKGWYIYYWTYKQTNIIHAYKNIKKKLIEETQDKLFRETSNTFFECLNTCVRLDFERAIQFDYRCPECGELLNQQDNSKKILQLREQLAQLEKELQEQS